MAGNEQHSWISLTSPDGALEWASAYFSGLAFSPHRHDTYAVGFTTRGVQCFTYRGAARNACPGDVFVLHPDELHDGRQGTDDGYGYCIAYIEPALIGEALDGTSLPFVTEAVNRDHRLKSAITEMFPDSQDANNDLHHAGAVTTGR